MGRLPAGKWLTREAYLDQLAFFDEHLRPSVLAYDIVFQDNVGETIRAQKGISGSPERISRIVEGLRKIQADSSESLSEDTLYDMNSLSLEQGNLNMAHRLASIAERKRFQTVIGYYFRTYLPGMKEDDLPEWSDEDVFGDDETGNESMGRSIPYLLDVSIPSKDVHFRPRSKYKYQRNAKLPASEMLDYALLGFLNAAPDHDGIMREVPLVTGFKYRNSKTKNEKNVFVPSLSLMACLLHFGVQFPLQPGAVEVFMGREIVIHSLRAGDVRIPVDDNGRLFLNFTAKFRDFNNESNSASFCDVAPSFSGKSRMYKSMAANAYRGRLNGRIVMVGVNSAGQDVGPCPIESRCPLMTVHLTAINNILNRNFIAPVSSECSFLLWICIFSAFTAVCIMEKTSRLGFVTILSCILYIVVAFACIYRSWVVLPVIGPLLYMVTCSLTVLSHRFLAEERERRRIREMFSTMVSDQVLDYLEENPDSFSLKGHNVEATVFFSDVVNFTGISERLTPERVTELLNIYLTPATDLILNHGGYVDKYVGDGVMAVWGAPYPDSEHAIKACLSALEQQEMLLRLNRQIKKDFGVSIVVRMGINSGIVKAGNMGSQRKFQYTVIGDAVNLASRLEPANKDFGTSIIAGESTCRMVQGRIVTRRLGKIVVVGKEDAVSIFEVLGKEGGVDPKKLEIVNRYELALDLFYKKEWSQCISLLDVILRENQDGPSEFLRRRATFYKENPPDMEWQCEYIRTEKG